MEESRERQEQGQAFLRSCFADGWNAVDMGQAAGPSVAPRAVVLLETHQRPELLGGESEDGPFSGTQ